MLRGLDENVIFPLVVWVNLLAMKLMRYFCKWYACLYSGFYWKGYSGDRVKGVFFLPVETKIVCNGGGFCLNSRVRAG